jgi:predicted Zn-dependent protease
MKNLLLLTAALVFAAGTAAPSFAGAKDQSSSTPNANSPATVEPSATKVPHDGGIDDVSAIGNRNVGCSRGMGNWYSLERQIALGKQISQQVETQSKVINDPVISEYINRLGQNIVRNSDSQVPFTIKVIDSDDINAFALPGGFFYVNSGLILAADEEAELAGVMAHEIGHVAACHAARENTRANLMQMMTIPLIFMGGPIGYAAYEGAGLAVPLTFLKFSRGFEAQADYLGVQYMYKAGYDPAAFISFFEKVQAMEKKKPGTISKAFETHPQTPDRIQASQEEIAKILPPKAEYIVTTSEFDEVKTRLAAIENRHKLNNDEKDGKKPTLRRASSTDKNGSDDKTTTDDGRPTLKRRPDDNNQ